MANAAIRAGFSSHTGLMAAGFSIQRQPGAGDGRLGVGYISTPAGFNTLEMLDDALGLFGLGGREGHGRLLGQLAGMHHEETELFHSDAAVGVFYCHLADDTLPVPASRQLLACTGRFFEP